MSEDKNYAGMTVNERLFAAGLIEAFDEAVSRRDRAELIRILESVEVGEPQFTVDALLANPTFYGFSN